MNIGKEFKRKFVLTTNFQIRNAQLFEIGIIQFKNMDSVIYSNSPLKVWNFVFILTLTTLRPDHYTGRAKYFMKFGMLVEYIK